MTVERRYLCNLCRESREPKPDEIVGVFFRSGEWLLITHPKNHHGSSVENHVCTKCLNALVAAARETEGGE